MQFVKIINDGNVFISLVGYRSATQLFKPLKCFNDILLTTHNSYLRKNNVRFNNIILYIFLCDHANKRIQQCNIFINRVSEYFVIVCSILKIRHVYFV